MGKIFKKKAGKKKAYKQKKRRKIPYSILTVTSFVAVIFALFAFVFAYTQLKSMERGILDVCATQQDAYVRLVLDQINLKDNRTDDEIIRDILQTMDASNNKYWTFSHESSMLFVKDVLETNKYMGFTTSTYYSSESANEFLRSLQLNRVKHADIEIQEKKYIASGVAFEYKDATYRLCLLTNRSALLDNNAFLGAKTQLTTLVVALILLGVVVPMGFAYSLRKQQLEKDDLDEVIHQQSLSIEELNRRFENHDIHDNKHNIWNKTALPTFLEKLVEKNIVPVTLAVVQFEDGASLKKLIERAGFMLGTKVFRFAYDERRLVFLFVKIGKEEAEESLNLTLFKGCKVETMYEMVDMDAWNIDNIYHSLGLSRE